MKNDYLSRQRAVQNALINQGKMHGEQWTISDDWEYVDGYNGLYAVSKNGEIVSFCKGKMHPIYPTLKENGYLRVYLSDGKKQRFHYLHRLIAKTFIPNPNNLPVVNHKDGDKLNNTVDNLEWCTVSQNSRHAVSIGLIKTMPIKYYGAIYPSIAEASRETGRMYRTIIKYGEVLSEDEKQLYFASKRSSTKSC